MERLRKYISQYLALSEESWSVFYKLFSEVNLRKGVYFATEGKQAYEIGFLTNGVMRAFYRSKDGQEYNKTFFTDNEFLGAYTSLITGTPNKINIQALTDCTLLVADYKCIVSLFDKYRQIETLARLISEYFYIYKEKREIELVLMQADERYEVFKQEYPDLENIIPQYHIASYLGITPTQLSRIRARKQ